MKHNKRAQRLLAALCCTALLAGWGGLEAFAKEAPALMTDESDGATAAQLLQETDDEWVTTATQPADAGSLSVAGKGAVLMELSSGQILFEQTPP